MKRVLLLLVCLCLLFVSCGVKKKTAELTVENGELVFFLGKSYHIIALNIAELQSKTMMWKLINTGDDSDVTSLYTSRIIYGRSYTEFEDVTDAISLKKGVEYRYLIDCGKVFFSGIFLIDDAGIVMK